jgi:hypothetical protein
MNKNKNKNIPKKKKKKKKYTKKKKKKPKIFYYVEKITYIRAFLGTLFVTLMD